MTVYKTWDENARANLMFFMEDSPHKPPITVEAKVYAEFLLKCQQKMSEYIFDLQHHVEPDEAILTSAFETCGNIAADMVWKNKTSVNEMLKVLVGKQKDYGHQNIMLSGKLGLACRMMDKIARLNNLITKRSATVNESLYDTWMDILGYAVIYRMVDNESFMTPLKEDIK